MNKEMNKMDRALSGTCAATSLLAIAMIPDSTLPIANGLASTVVMAAAFVLWGD